MVSSCHLYSNLPPQAVTGGAAPFGPALIEMFMKKVNTCFENTNFHPVHRISPWHKTTLPAQVEPNVIEFREGFGMTETSPLATLQVIRDIAIARGVYRLSKSVMCAIFFHIPML